MAISKEIIMRSPDDLRPYEKNARTHSPEQIAKIAHSLQEFGFVNPVLVSGDMIVAGHGRCLAAKELGLKEVPTLSVEGLTPEQVRAYIIADNRLAEDAGWDETILREELLDLDKAGFDISVTGFDFTIDADLINTNKVGEDAAEEEDPFQKLPQSRVYLFAISAFGVNGDKLMCREIEEDAAEKIIKAVADAGPENVSRKITEALADDL